MQEKAIGLIASLIFASNVWAEIDVYPRVHDSKESGNVIELKAGKVEHRNPFLCDESAYQLASAILADKDIGLVMCEASHEGIVPASAIPKVAGGYYLKTTPKAVIIVGADRDGTYYAAQTLSQLVQGDRLPEVEITDWPDVPFRGSVEGFYGRVWTHQARLSQIRFYGKYKLNTYIYAPKDDPYHRDKWRENYPPKKADELRELARVGAENHVNVTWGLHLGDFNTNKKEEEKQHILSKLEFMHGLGFRSFAALFDDFGGADANLHAEICNFITTEFLEKKKDCAPLVMCPNDYSGWGSSQYCKKLGERLHKDVRIMWTGRSICNDIDEKALAAVEKSYQRPPYIWWNWPVVDYCSTALLLGRTYGLDKANKGHYAGVTSNPMDKPEASKIALFGVADYCWNIDGFNSEKSWHDSMKRLYPGNADAMQKLADHSSDQGDNGHGYRREESVAFKPVLDRARAEFKLNGKISEETARKLQAEFQAMADAGQELEATLPARNPMLWEEIQCWVRTLTATGKLGMALIPFVDGNRDIAGRVDAACKVMAALDGRNQASEAQRAHAKQLGAPHQNPAKLGGLHVKPFIDAMITDGWNTVVRGAGSEVKVRQLQSYKAFSNVKQLKNAQAERNGIYVNLRKINEQVSIAPDEYVGMALPEGVFANYIHVELDNPKASESGLIEVSCDGKNWREQNVRKNGQEMQTELNVNQKIRYFRYRNTVATPIVVRFNRFKFDVPGDSRANDQGAMFDGDPLSFFTITAPQRFTSEGKATTAYVLTNGVVKLGNDGDKATVEVAPAPGQPAGKIYEILWK